MKIDEAIQMYVRWKFSSHKRAAEIYGGHLRIFKEWLKQNRNKTNIEEVDEVDTGLFQNWMLKKDYAQTTISHFIISIKDLVKYFYLKKVTDFNFQLIQVPPSIPRFRRIATGPEEIDQICSIIGETLLKDLRDKLIFNFFLSSGVRVSELVGLNVKQIDVRKQSVSIPNMKHPGGYRVICWDDDTHRLLMLWLEKRQFIARDEALFIGFSGKNRYKRMTSRSVQRLVKQHAIRAGVENAARITPHTIRHGFCQTSQKSGLRLDQTQQLMGHLHIESTKKYLQWLDVELERAYRERFSRNPEEFERKSGFSINDIVGFNFDPDIINRKIYLLHKLLGLDNIKLAKLFDMEVEHINNILRQEDRTDPVRMI